LVVVALLARGGPGRGEPPAADARQKALEERQQALAEADALERAHAAERIRLRIDLLEKTEQVRRAEHGLERQRGAEARDIERQMDMLRQTLQPGPELNAALIRLGDRLAQLRAAEQRAAAELLAPRKAVIEAEEQLQLLDERHALQRRVALARIEAAEARLAAAEGRDARPRSAEQRLDDLERKVDQLLRELGELRRKLDRPREEGK
jgi:hypothetical protein